MANLASGAQSDEANALQSYESCSLITSEYLTILQLADRGLDMETLKASLPDLTDPGARRLEALLSFADSEGIVEAHSTVHSQYAQCAKGVFDRRGVPEPGTRENYFHQCAGESKLRYEFSLAATLNTDVSDVVAQVPPQHHATAARIFEIHHNQGTSALFDVLASELKQCLKQAGQFF
ncbi:hypothetical protein LPB19_12865 [Marinobacter salinisoli]|uniref:Uncharacterized protein n=1 Tax=Marinobacter salinisoli TaxID=2769486 RepID=A0ABX7MRR9_9GAMM|nr:hypothetical protein [Marinobacter salinisoli]QSP94079.1 hypothetical protein LPB19_12865 [Marinobacter salinisoli]